MLVDLPETWPDLLVDPMDAALLEPVTTPGLPGFVRSRWLDLSAALPGMFLRHTWFDAWAERDPDERARRVLELRERGLPVEPYGIVDSPSQVLKLWPFLATDENAYAVVWRRERGVNPAASKLPSWLSWGPYLGRGRRDWAERGAVRFHVFQYAPHYA